MNDMERTEWMRAAVDQFRVFQRAMYRTQRRASGGDGVLATQAHVLEVELYPSSLWPDVMHPSFCRRWREGRYRR